MDLGVFGSIHFDLNFLSALLSIVLIDLILAGDNAVVIAMAVRSLPREQRKKGILFGAGAAVLLRVVITFFVAQLLNVSYVKLIGGALILWIAVKLFVEGAPEEGRERSVTTIWQAIRIIVIADITMSLDNMLAVGGASHGNMFLLLFGLGLSIPFIVFTSNLLSLLMDKYPVIIYAGAAILGKVGGEMMLTDPLTVRFLPASLLDPASVVAGRAAPLTALLYSVEAFFAAAVIVAGKLGMRLAAGKEAEVIGAPGEHAVVPAEKPRPILTISREYGSGGSEIGQAVCRELGYEYLDRERILADIRADGPKWEAWARDLDEHRPTVWEKYDWSFRGFGALVQWHILEHALRGGVVIMGRGGNFVLDDVPHAYRIRVTAPLEERIERVVRREGVDREMARWLCEKTDRERSGFLHAVYGRRWDDPTEYDRVITVEGQSVDAEARQVIEELNRRPITAEAREVLRMKTLAAKVLAGIATDPTFFIPVLEIIPEGGKLILRGVTHTPQEHRRVEAAAARLAGSVPVRCELHYRK